jgi:Fe-S cluster biosynthesis and repair protein YggX
MDYMTRTVNCVVLNREAEGLDAPPHPGALGQRIYDNVSKEGWRRWLERLAMIVNENGINTADPRSVEIIEKHMLGFLFGEGEFGGLPQGFRPPGAK